MSFCAELDLPLVCRGPVIRLLSLEHETKEKRRLLSPEDFDGIQRHDLENVFDAEVVDFYCLSNR